MRILHLISALDGDGSARQVQLLAPTLAGASAAVEVCCLGAVNSQVETLRRAGVTVHVLGWTRWLDAPALWSLRRLLRAEAYEVIHAWGLPALRLVALLAPDRLPRVVFSAAQPTPGRFRWWDRRAVERVRCVAVASDVERSHWVRLGLTARRCEAVPNAVAMGEAAAPDVASEDGQRIVCTGRLERGRGFREAIWAIDVLRYVFPRVRLAIAGSGPYRADLDWMIERLRIDNACLVGDTVEPGPLLASAEVCWVPSRANCGRQAALEALAAGRPVIASDVPCLRELIRDGETGYLVPPGEPIILARRTRALLQDPELRRRLGTAGRDAVRECFALPQVAARWHALYNEVAA